MKSYSMFMAAISKGLEMGLASLRALKIRSCSVSPGSAAAGCASSEEAASEAASEETALLAGAEDAAEEAGSEELELPPQPARSAAARAAAIKKEILRFIIEKIPFFGD